MTEMLEIFFCNVGDGDAILLTERREGRPDYTVLIDAGRPYVDPKNGSLRKEAIYYLKARGVTRIDRMILTHPHIDHVGGAVRILEQIPVARLTVPILPPEDAVWLSPSFVSTDKAQNGLRHLLNVMAGIVQTARRCGTEVDAAKDGGEQLSERLLMTTYLPGTELFDRAKLVYERLYRGVPVSDALVHAVSRERNQTSLMHRFTYAGRSVLLTGDRYGFDWEAEDVAPCDVLKLPHHGDSKSVTRELIGKLSPSLAVISCQTDPKKGKDRPSAETLQMVSEVVPAVACTENREMPGMPAATHNGVCCRIGEDGRLFWRFE